MSESNLPPPEGEELAASESLDGDHEGPGGSAGDLAQDAMNTTDTMDGDREATIGATDVAEDAEDTGAAGTDEGRDDSVEGASACAKFGTPLRIATCLVHACCHGHTKCSGVFHRLLMQRSVQ